VQGKPPQFDHNALSKSSQILDNEMVEKLSTELEKEKEEELERKKKLPLGAPGTV